MSDKQESNGYLSGAAILEVDDVRIMETDVPEWGGKVRFVNMSGEALSSFLNSLVEIKGDQVIQNRTNVYAKLLARCICDEKGRRLFNDKQIDALGLKDGAVLSRLYNLAQKHNGIDEEAQENAGKNSEATTDSVSVSA